MYESFYGLENKPFQLNPDPKFYFGSKQHQRARAYLEYGLLRSEGFIVITGEVGAGKTTLVRGLLDGLDTETVVAANLVSTQLDAENTLRLVGAAFGINIKKISKSEILLALEAFFISQLIKGKRCLLIVDEAQNLQIESIEELRMLSNFQHEKQALLQTFLIGQPEFREILQSPELLQFRQRVTATCHIGPLDFEDTKKYIEHRVICAGKNNTIDLKKEIFQNIYNYTEGVPRRINNLMDRILLSGYLINTKEIGLTLIKNVIKEIEEESFLFKNDKDLTKLQKNKSFECLNIDKNLDPAEKIFVDSQLNRLEHSALRQEKISLEILMAIQKIYKEIKNR